MNWNRNIFSVYESSNSDCVLGYSMFVKLAATNVYNWKRSR
jgi:hypothetical protein